MSHSTEEHHLEQRIARLDLSVDEEVNAILEKNQEAMRKEEEISTLQRSLLTANLLEKLSLGLFHQDSDGYVKKLSAAERSYEELKLRVRFRVSARRRQGEFRDLPRSRTLKYVELDPPGFALERAEKLLNEMPIGSYFIHNSEKEGTFYLSIVLPDVVDQDVSPLLSKRVAQLPLKGERRAKAVTQMCQEALDEAKAAVKEQLPDAQIEDQLHYLH